METTIKAAKVGGRWIAFREDADLEEFDPTKISDWKFSSADCTTGSLIRVSDGVVDFGLTRDSKGFPDASAYATAYDVSFALVHLEKFTSSEAALDAPTRSQIEALPPTILREYVFRTDTSRSATTDEIKSLYKPKGGQADGSKKK